MPGPDLIVALDVDGTILDMDGCVSERVMASIARMRAWGAQIVISTGRGIQAALPVARCIGLIDGWMVCANGALTVRMDPGAPDGYEIVDHAVFDPAPAIDALLAAVPDGIVAVEGPGPDDPGTAGGTRTRVVAVEGAEREQELARMLSGHEDSDAALRHAAELLEEAAVAQSQA